MDKRETDVKRLQEQLREPQQASEARQATEVNQSQSSQLHPASDASQAQEELVKLRQEVLWSPYNYRLCF